MQVREACSILDLDVLFYPCPKDGPNWRPKVGLRAWPSCAADEERVSLVDVLYRLDTIIVPKIVIRQAAMSSCLMSIIYIAGSFCLYPAMLHQA